MQKICTSRAYHEKIETVVVSGQGSPSLLMALVVVDLALVKVVHFLSKKLSNK